MVEQKTPADAVLEVLRQGSREDARAFMLLLEPVDAFALLEDLPEQLRGRAVDALEPPEQQRLVEGVLVPDLAQFLEGLPPQVAADVLEELEEDLRNEVFAHLELEEQAEVLREVDDEEAREELLEAIPDEDLADIAEEQRSDDATDLIEELDEERQKRVLEEMEADKRAQIEALHRYPRESAGGIMQTELLKLRENLTVEQAIEVVRSEYDPHMGDVFDLYVVDEEGHVLGRVRNRHLVVNPAGTAIRDVMKTDVVTVPVDMDQEEIAEIVQDYDVPSVAVLDENRCLVGRVLVDDIVDVIEEEATEDVAKMAGTDPEDVHTRSVLLTIRARLPWLLGTFAGGLTVALLMLRWDEQLMETVPLFAAVIPVVMALSGNVAMQAATVTVRGIAIGDIDYGELREVIVKEMLAGAAFSLLFLGLLYVVTVTVIPNVTDLEWPAELSLERIALVPALSLAVMIVAASSLGTLVPLVLHRLDKDPAVASAPFITTSIDLLAVCTVVGTSYLIL